MDLSTLPLHIFTEIIYSAINQLPLAKGLELRLISHTFNREILRAIFRFDILRFRTRWPYGYYIPFDSLAMVRYLHGLMSIRVSRDEQQSQSHWQTTIKQGAIILEKLIPDTASIKLLHERSTTVEFRGSSGWVYHRVMCEAIVRFLGPGECFRSIVSEDELSSIFGAPYLCILNRSVTFWVVVAACHLGDPATVSLAIAELSATLDHRLDWRIHLNGCMYVAARSGRAAVVELLIHMGLDVSGRAYRGFGSFLAGDGTPLSGATKAGSLEVVELILRQDVIKEGSTYDMALYECLRHKDRIETRAKILKRLLEEGLDLRNRPDLRNRLLAKAFRLDSPEMVNVILDYDSSGLLSY